MGISSAIAKSMPWVIALAHALGIKHTEVKNVNLHSIIDAVRRALAKEVDANPDEAAATTCSLVKSLVFWGVEISGFISF